MTIVKLFSQASGVAVDMSPAALAVAASNAKAHAVAERLDFVRADFTQPIFNESEFDLIVSILHMSLKMNMKSPVTRFVILSR